MLIAVCKTFETGYDEFYLDHEIHDKGDNRNLEIAMGYTLKDGGGGVQPPRHHYMNRNNFGDTDSLDIANGLYMSWCAPATLNLSPT